jgi:hypothetical protein
VRQAEHRDNDGYLKWRRDPMSGRERVLSNVGYVAFVALQSLPRSFTSNHHVILGCAIAGYVLALAGTLWGLSKIHSY